VCGPDSGAKWFHSMFMTTAQRKILGDPSPCRVKKIDNCISILLICSHVANALQNTYCFLCLKLYSQVFILTKSLSYSEHVYTYVYVNC
jgi:hypothetical protein